MQYRMQRTPVGPWQSALAVTPADGADLVAPGVDPNAPTDGLLFAAAAGGTLKVDMADRTTVTLTFPATAAGFPMPLSVKRIYATGTTVTNIVAFWS